MDDKAKRVFPREWNLVYIALPMVNKREQHRPTLEGEEIETILSQVKRPIYTMIAALLAGTGMRITELLALEIGKHTSSDCTVVKVRQQRSKNGNHIVPYTKTDAGVRDIDLAPKLSALLKGYIGERKSGFLFETENGTMLDPGNLWRDGFAKIVEEMGRQASFNSFRRFRESVLQASECRDLLIDYWMGHTNSDMASRYGKQLVENRKFRAEWSAKVGLGFELPSRPALFGICGIQNQEKEVAA